MTLYVYMYTIWHHIISVKNATQYSQSFELPLGTTKAATGHDKRVSEQLDSTVPYLPLKEVIEQLWNSFTFSCLSERILISCSCGTKAEIFELSRATAN